MSVRRLSEPFPCGEGEKEGRAGLAKGLRLSQLQGLGWGLPPSRQLTRGSPPLSWFQLG